LNFNELIILLDRNQIFASIEKDSIPYAEPKNDKQTQKVQSSGSHIIALYGKDQYCKKIFAGKGFSRTNYNEHPEHISKILLLYKRK
jgi:hypothetical protein